MTRRKSKDSYIGPPGFCDSCKELGFMVPALNRPAVRRQSPRFQYYCVYHNVRSNGVEYALSVWRRSWYTAPKINGWHNYCPTKKQMEIIILVEEGRRL